MNSFKCIEHKNIKILQKLTKWNNLKKNSWSTIKIEALKGMKTSFKPGEKFHMERKRASYNSRNFDAIKQRNWNVRKNTMLY